MEEKVLIKSTTYNMKKIFCIMLVLFAIPLLYGIIQAGDILKGEMEYYRNHTYYGGKYGGCSCMNSYTHHCQIMYYSTALGYALDFNSYEMAREVYPWVVLGIVGIAVSILSYFWLKNYELVVTDKRIHGKAAFGKRVDLPADSISSTATIRLLRGVAVATSSGKISFLAIKNADEIYGVINNLLIERQKEKAKESAPVTIIQSDEADQLKKYKALLDSGVITQEEFDAKKKQLLGL